MESPLYGLICQFKRDTAAAVGDVLARSGVSHPFDWRDSGRPLSGILPGDPPIHYRFHGGGLCVARGQVDVDFDFGFDGRTTGFNEYWLEKYAEARPGPNPEFCVEPTRLNHAFREARSEGDIIQPFRHRQDTLWYLREDARE